MKLQDKVCIITGAGQGIGLATARRFAAEGAVVVVCDLRQAEVGAAVAECRKLGGPAQRTVGFTLSVTDRAQVDTSLFHNSNKKWTVHDLLHGPRAERRQRRARTASAKASPRWP